MTTTKHTHCHIVMQARALRVPEVCVYHTPSFILGGAPSYQDEVLSFEHGGAP